MAGPDPVETIVTNLEADITAKKLNVTKENIQALAAQINDLAHNGDDAKREVWRKRLVKLRNDLSSTFDKENAAEQVTKDSHDALEGLRDSMDRNVILLHGDSFGDKAKGVLSLIGVGTRDTANLFTKNPDASSRIFGITAVVAGLVWMKKEGVNAWNGILTALGGVATFFGFDKFRKALNSYGIGSKGPEVKTPEQIEGELATVAEREETRKKLFEFYGSERGDAAGQRKEAAVNARAALGKEKDKINTLPENLKKAMAKRVAEIDLIITKEIDTCIAGEGRDHFHLDEQLKKFLKNLPEGKVLVPRKIDMQEMDVELTATDIKITRAGKGTKRLKITAGSLAVPLDSLKRVGDGIIVDKFPFNGVPPQKLDKLDDAPLKKALEVFAGGGDRFDDPTPIDLGMTKVIVKYELVP